MKNIYKVGFLFSAVIVLCFSTQAFAFAQSVPQVQTISATNIQNNSATLNAQINYLGSSSNATVYFQWGASASYGNQTPVVAQNYIGAYSQTAYNLVPNSTYHFRIVAQNSYGTTYGQDMTFYTAQSSGGFLTANAGPDLYLTSGQTTNLQGYGYDPTGHALNYSWACNGGTLSSYSIAQPIFTAPYTYNNQTNYTCTLTVTNSVGNSSSDSMIIYEGYGNNGNNNGGTSVQTTFATYVSNVQATLNGSLSGNNLSASNYIHFEWGTTTSYGNETSLQSVGSTNLFMQTIQNLNFGTTYHFRAVAQGNYGTIYGQDITFTTIGSGLGNYNNSSSNSFLSVTKQVTDLSSGNSNWVSSVNAKPGDILSFAVTLQSNGQDVHNIVVKDTLPTNLIYKGNLAVNTNSNYGGDITAGVNIGTIYANQIIVVSYQAQVAPDSSFSFGANTLTSNATVTSNEAGAQNSSATVVVNKTLVYGASSVSTGLTNNFFTDSFFLPMLILVAGLWFYFSGEIYVLAAKLKEKVKR